MICTIWFLTVLTLGNMQQRVFHDVDNYLLNKSMDAIIIQQTIVNPKSKRYEKIVTRTMLTGVMKMKCVRAFVPKDEKRNY